MPFGWGSREERTPLDELARLIEKGRPIPLTTQVRLDLGKAIDLVRRVEVASPEGQAARDRLEGLLQGGRPVPLTNEHRIERDEAMRLIDEVREWK